MKESAYVLKRLPSVGTKVGIGDKHHAIPFFLDPLMKPRRK